MNISDNKKNENNDQMTFWEHLEELRSVLIRSAIGVIVLSIVAFSFKTILFDYILLGPARSDFITYEVLCRFGQLFSIDSFCFDISTLQFINITLAGQFISHLTVSFVAGLVLSSPYIVFEFWRFIRPGLTKKERARSRGTVFTISSLFLGGVLFSYFLVVPLMINFLGNYQVSEMVPNQLAISSYTGSVTTMCLMMGLMFEFPVVMVFLTKTGIITPLFMKKYRKHTFIIILIVSGLITPSPDIISQVIVTLPLYILYEISLNMSIKIYKRKQKEESNTAKDVT